MERIYKDVHGSTWILACGCEIDTECWDMFNPDGSHYCEGKNTTEQNPDKEAKLQETCSEHLSRAVAVKEEEGDDEVDDEN